MSRVRWGVVVCCLMLIGIATPGQAASGDYRVKRLTNETSYVRSKVGERVFAAQIASPVQLKVVLAHDKVDGPRETVQSMCRRYHCLVGINGDFFGGPTRHGAIVIDGHVLRTAMTDSSQLWLANSPRMQMKWLSPDIVLKGATKSFHLPLNPATNLGIGAIYTSAYGGVLTVPHGGLIQVYQCSCRGRPDYSGKTYRLHKVGTIRDARKVMLGPAQVAVRLMPSQVKDISGGLARVVRLSVPKRIPDADDAIGAHPILITRGKISQHLTDSFATSLHPRSVFAYNAAGKAWIIAVDTRVSLVRAAQIALKLGATEAINLDGGGSTTFVVHGRTVNNPADKAEREVASALIVVETAAKTTRHTVKPKPKRAPVKPHPTPKLLLVRPVVIRSPMRVAPRPIAIVLETPPQHSLAGIGVAAGLLIGCMTLLLYGTRKRS